MKPALKKKSEKMDISAYLKIDGETAVFIRRLREGMPYPVSLRSVILGLVKEGIKSKEGKV